MPHLLLALLAPSASTIRAINPCHPVQYPCRAMRDAVGGWTAHLLLALLAPSAGMFVAVSFNPETLFRTLAGLHATRWAAGRRTCFWRCWRPAPACSWLPAACCRARSQCAASRRAPRRCSRGGRCALSRPARQASCGAGRWRVRRQEGVQGMFHCVGAR